MEYSKLSEEQEGGGKEVIEWQNRLSARFAVARDPKRDCRGGKGACGLRVFQVILMGHGRHES